MISSYKPPLTVKKMTEHLAKSKRVVFKNPPENSPLLVWEMNRAYFILCVIGNNGSIYRYKFIYVIYNMYER